MQKNVFHSSYLTVAAAQHMADRVQQRELEAQQVTKIKANSFTGAYGIISLGI